MEQLSHIWPRSAALHGDVLHLAGLPVDELVRIYGTPLYVLDEDTFRAGCRAYRDALSAAYPASSAVYYSGKSLLNLTVAKLVADEGCHLDVVSATEIHLARAAGIPASRLHLHGNGKPPAELDLAIEQGVGAIVVDNLSELAAVAAKARSQGIPVGVVLRLSPGIAVATHPHISTGLATSKFGIPYETLSEAIVELRSTPELQLKGVHLHLGSQISELEPYRAAIEFLLDARERLASELGVLCEEICPGGGFAAAYRDGDEEPDITTFVKLLAESTVASCARRAVPLPMLVVEPGRSISARSVVAVYSVVGEKEISEGRAFEAEGYVHVDGGMGDNLRPALYGARYEVLAAGKATQPRNRTMHVAGRYCESSDILVRSAKLPPLRGGDLLAMPACGAYTLSMASNYNMTPRPALVMVRDGAHALVQRREGFEDLIRRDTGIAGIERTAFLEKAGKA
jgi:diaminopimelate decarboxylase